MPATDQQLRAIAFLAKDCRPHGARIWDEGGIYANLTKVRDRSLGSIIIAAVQAAEDRGAGTPGVIPTAGPHWRTPEAAVVTSADKAQASEHCATCGHTETACRIRWAGDHEFISVAASRAQRHTPEVLKEIHEAIAADIKPMREPTHTTERVTPGAGRARLDEQTTEPTPARPEETS